MSLQFRAALLTLSWIWLGVIIILSLISIPGSVTVSIPHIDKIEHTFSYFILMFLFGQCYVLTRTRIIYAMFFIALGISLEYLQSLTATRQFEYADMIANTTGVFLGLLLSDSLLQKVVIAVDNKLKIIFKK